MKSGAGEGLDSRSTGGGNADRFPCGTSGAPAAATLGLF